MIREQIYRFIYNRHVNYLLRRVNKVLSPLLPAAIRIPPSGVIRLKTAGCRFVLATNQTSYLTQRVFWEGPEAFEYTPIFTRLIRKTGTFFDIGSNIGYYTVIACAVNSDVRVWSFEPAEGAFRYLRRNVELNRIREQVMAEKIALSDRAGTFAFREVKNDKYPFTRDVLSGESNVATKELDREFATCRVQGMTLDAYCRKNKVRKIDLIKIDTEGSEAAILAGGREVIARDRPVIICELLYNFNEAEIERFMRECGYGFYVHHNRRLRKVGTIVRNRDDGVRDCFFVHPDRYALIGEFVTTGSG